MGLAGAANQIAFPMGKGYRDLPFVSSSCPVSRVCFFIVLVRRALNATLSRQVKITKDERILGPNIHQAWIISDRINRDKK